MADYVDEYREAFAADGGNPDEVERIERAFGIPEFRLGARWSG